MKKSKYQLIPLLLVFLLLLTACGNAAQGADELPVQSSLLTVSAAQTTPNDQPTSWATAGVERARSLGLVTDEMNQGFQSATTRAEFCRLVSRMLIIFYEAPIDYIIEARGLTPHNFNDTEDYAIRAAAALGITSGTGNGNFSPEQPLTREQAATMLRNVMDVIGLETANHPAIAWTDAGEIASWARDATDVMYAAKIMNGTSSQTLVFSPKTPYSREQALITVLNLWDYAMDQGTSHELPNVDVDYGKPDTSGTPTPSPSPTAGQRRQYDINDPNVQKYPFYATVTSPKEFQDAMRELNYGMTTWQSAAEIVAELHRQGEDPANWINGVPNYESRMKPVQEWVDHYLLENGLTYAGKTDYEKTAIIRQIIEDESLFEEFIGLWKPNYRFTREANGLTTTNGDCAPRATAVQFLMIALDFELFDVVGVNTGLAHGCNGYWDSTVGAIRFLDAHPRIGVWNLYVDELYAQKGWLLD